MHRRAFLAGAGASLIAGQAWAPLRLRRVALVATGLAAASLTLLLTSGAAFSQPAGITIGRAIWVVAPFPTLDITVDVGQICNGKTSCQFLISPATFGGKTPPGAGVHLLIVQYKCGAIGKNGMGHDADTMTLSCP